MKNQFSLRISALEMQRYYSGQARRRCRDRGKWPAAAIFGWVTAPIRDPRWCPRLVRDWVWWRRQATRVGVFEAVL